MIVGYVRRWCPRFVGLLFCRGYKRYALNMEPLFICIPLILTVAIGCLRGRSFRYFSEYILTTEWPWNRRSLPVSCAWWIRGRILSWHRPCVFDFFVALLLKQTAYFVACVAKVVPDSLCSLYRSWRHRLLFWLWLHHGLTIVRRWLRWQIVGHRPRNKSSVVYENKDNFKRSGTPRRTEFASLSWLDGQ